MAWPVVALGARLTGLGGSQDSAISQDSNGVQACGDGNLGMLVFPHTLPNTLPLGPDLLPLGIDFNPTRSTTNCRAAADAVDHYFATWEFQPAPDIKAGPVDKYPFRHAAGPWKKMSPVDIVAALHQRDPAFNGIRGIVWVKVSPTQAHVFNVINRNGQIVAIDGQSGQYGSFMAMALRGIYFPDPAKGWAFLPTK